MEYRKLGNSSVKVSAISIGAWLTFGNTVEEKLTHNILDAAVDNGINFVDVADVYALGKAESVVGTWLKDRDRSKLIVSSKVYWPMSKDVNDRGLSRKHIIESVEKSLKRLQTDYLDIYFCHRYDEETPLEETVRAMDDLVHQGKVLYWGTSVWEADQLRDAIDICQDHFLYRPQVEQPRYNMFDRNIEDKIIRSAAENGMGLVVFSPLGQGVLTGKYNDSIPLGSRGADAEWLPEYLTESYLQKVRKLTSLANDLQLSMSQLALVWVLRKPEISSAITGATDIKHVESNIRAIEALPLLTKDVMDAIDTILN
ncbi:MAG: aldo/keto reductase family protein [Candidatus Marinimicrobia bacterium]|nr:aldo/keto reductase family protein [Candidatus Neomarinimicrobiota bacterium]